MNAYTRISDGFNCEPECVVLFCIYFVTRAAGLACYRGKRGWKIFSVYRECVEREREWNFSREIRDFKRVRRGGRGKIFSFNGLEVTRAE